MLSRRLLIVSAAANLVLACVVAYAALRNNAPASSRVETRTNFVTNVTTVVVSTNQTLATNAPGRNRFRWSELESEDCAEYVANLRAAGCPERTIHDIVWRKLRSQFERKRDELETEDNFWINGAERAAINRERQRQVLALEDEHMKLVQQVFGDNWLRVSERTRDRLEFLMVYALVPSATPDEAKDLMSVIRNYDAEARRLRREIRNTPVADDDPRPVEMAKQLKDDLSKRLPPHELEEFALRFAAIRTFDLLQDTAEAGLSLSPEEFRRIVQIYTAGRNGVEALFLNNLPGQDDDPVADMERHRAAREQVTGMLGAMRSEKFLAATDNDYESALEFVNAEDLRPAMARTLYEIQQAAEGQALRITHDPALTPSERRRALKEVRTATETALATTLDEPMMEAYQNKNGAWLKNLGRY
jgi:hypothetical protein